MPWCHVNNWNKQTAKKKRERRLTGDEDVDLRGAGRGVAGLVARIVSRVQVFGEDHGEDRLVFTARRLVIDRDPPPQVHVVVGTLQALSLHTCLFHQSTGTALNNVRAVLWVRWPVPIQSACSTGKRDATCSPVRRRSRRRCCRRPDPSCAGGRSTRRSLLFVFFLVCPIIEIKKKYEWPKATE